MKTVFLVLSLSCLCLAQQPPTITRQQPTIAQIRAVIQNLKDENVQIAARNNQTYTDFMGNLDYIELLQMTLKATQDTVAILKKKELQQSGKIGVGDAKKEGKK